MTPEQLKAKYNSMLVGSGLESIAAELGVEVKSRTDEVLDSLITFDHKLLAIKDRVRKLAPLTLPVLILGETGTGKELVATALHGDRPPATFVAINCGAIPSDLLESELFGSVKGAFTGSENRTGLIERANGGTLFLDEIGDMPKLLQCKLLRVLQERRYRKVGGTAEQKVDFRLVSATNHLDLETKESFRLDLYYRLAGHVIHLPPLRERGEKDLEAIVRNLCKDELLVKEVLLALADSKLPGNVRQVENIVRETMALA